MEEFKCLVTTLTNQNSVQEEIKSSLKSFCAESFIFQFPIQKYKEKIHITIILPVLYGCETWILTLREKRRLWVFENRVLRRIYGPKRDRVTGE